MEPIESLELEEDNTTEDPSFDAKSEDEDDNNDDTDFIEDELDDNEFGESKKTKLKSNSKSKKKN